MIPPWRCFSNSPLFSERIALQVLQGETFTWRRLATTLQALSSYLAQQGVTKQSGIALCGKNSLELVLFYLAAIQLGARVLPLNPIFPTEKILELCRVNDIEFFLCRSEERR